MRGPSIQEHADSATTSTRPRDSQLYEDIDDNAGEIPEYFEILDDSLSKRDTYMELDGNMNHNHEYANLNSESQNTNNQIPLPNDDYDDVAPPALNNI